MSSMAIHKKSLLMLFTFLILLGLIYPFAIYLLGKMFFPDKTVGELTLIGQDFSSPKYFHGRPSNVGYRSECSGGSNWGAGSIHLKSELDERIKKYQHDYHVISEHEIPPEMLFSSASGLDPDISVQAALFQVERIARSRKLSPNEAEELKDMIKAHEVLPDFGLLGRERVNVVSLNMNMDEVFQGR